MRLKANAKINLTLDIVGRADNGYHLLDSLFQSVSLCDDIEIKKSDVLTVSFNNADVTGSESIAYKAAETFFEKTGISNKAEIIINSNIPLGSGMGGGSTDAAGVLVGLNRLFNAGLTTDELIDIGKRIGADVPFCIVGGTARVKGIGEKIERLPFMGKLPLVIIKDGKKTSTAEMYKQIDSIPDMKKYTPYAVSAVNSRDVKALLVQISNAFNEVCFSEREKELLKNSGAVAVGLSGSGPSVFGIFDSDVTAEKTYNKLLKAGHNVFYATTEENGIVIE